jgi:HAD superfamily hydrolase (TIGR01509 family)
MFRALIFDFDGTILDTETPECGSWQALYAEHEYTFPLSEFHAAVGRGYDPNVFEPLSNLHRLLGGASPPERLKDRQRAHFQALILGQETRPGVRDWLAEAGTLGWGRAVASSSERLWIDRHLPRLGLDSQFDAIRTKDDVGPGRTKPHPDLFLAACDALGVSPERAIVIEDSENGVKAARAAGCFTVAVPNPMTAHMDFSLADLVLPSLDERKLKSLLE